MHCANFERVCAKIVEEADADILFGCQIGAFRQGFSIAGIHVGNLLRNQFGDGVRFEEVHDYLSVWNLFRSPRPAVVSLHGNSRVFHVPGSRDVYAVIARFDVNMARHGQAHVITGNMHIVCGKHLPTLAQRQRAVRALRVHLDGLAAPDPDTPVVRIILGDDNLKSLQAREALQRHNNDESPWEVFASEADMMGDHVAVSGAAARFLPVAVGCSFVERGVRHDSHDAVALVVALRGASQPANENGRKFNLDELVNSCGRLLAWACGSSRH